MTEITKMSITEMRQAVEQQVENEKAQFVTVSSPKLVGATGEIKKLVNFFNKNARARNSLNK